MQRRITGFHQDAESHWVAELECGHTQHVRHEPPLSTRMWVLEERTRAAHLGTMLTCLLCDTATPTDPVELSAEEHAAYQDALLRGLCHEGALEAARRRPVVSLFQPISFRSVTARNRIVVSPMCQYSSVDGFSHDWHLIHLGSRAVGGAGIVFTEATAVLAEGRISPGDLGIWSDAHIEGLARVTRAIHASGAVPGIQLAHAGRKASHAVPWEGDQQLPDSAGGWTTVAPSAIPFRSEEQPPLALDEAGIRQVIEAFVAAARRADVAGFDIIELHAAHGYLLAEFLSPLSNRRTDGYGGSLAHRTRLLREIVLEVRKVWPAEKPVFVRISATDWAEGGWDIEQSVVLARELAVSGVDLVDCSSGGVVPGVKIPAGPGYQVPFAARIRQETGMPTGAVGMITTPEQAEAILAAGHADLIFLAREMLRDPYWPLHAAKALGVQVDWPAQYLRARV